MPTPKIEYGYDDGSPVRLGDRGEIWACYDGRAHVRFVPKADICRDCSMSKRPRFAAHLLSVAAARDMPAPLSSGIFLG